MTAFGDDMGEVGCAGEDGFRCDGNVFVCDDLVELSAGLDPGPFEENAVFHADTLFDLHILKDDGVSMEPSMMQPPATKELRQLEPGA